jgi:hypothetical protein
MFEFPNLIHINILNGRGAPSIVWTSRGFGIVRLCSMAKLDLIEAFQPSCRICRNLKNKIYKKKLSYLPTVNSDTLRESAKRCRYCRLIYDSIATVFDREFSQIEIHNWPTASKTLMLELGTGPTHGSLWPNKELLELFIPYGQYGLLIHYS